MNEEELKAKQEELERKEGELKQKENDLKTKETELNEKELSIRECETDAPKVTQTIKQEFEKRMAKKEEEFSKKLKERDDIIKQLAAGDEAEAADEDNPFTRLNKRRREQKAF